jgi:hypothetical protein
MTMNNIAAATHAPPSETPIVTPSTIFQEVVTGLLCKIGVPLEVGRSALLLVTVLVD